MSSVTVYCPFCAEPVELELEADLSGSFVQDCEVCCHPWAVTVERDADGEPLVTVEKSS